MARRTNLISAILGGVGGGIEAGLEQRERTLSARERAEERQREAERLAQQTARQGQLDIAAMADKPGWTTPEARTTALRGAAPGLQEVMGMVPGMLGREAPRGLSEAGQAALSQAAGQFNAPSARVTLGGQEFVQAETPTQRAMREAAATAGQERRKTQETTQVARAEEDRAVANAKAAFPSMTDAQARDYVRTGKSPFLPMDEEAQQRLALTAAGQAQTAAALQRRIAESDRDYALRLREQGRREADSTSRMTRLPVSVQQKIAGFNTGVQTAREAAEAIEASPEALGLKNLLPGLVVNRLDIRGGASGVPVRALLENLSGEIRNQRFGGQLTASEAKLAERFLPDARDTPQAALDKLTQLEQFLESKRKGLFDVYEVEYAPLYAPSAPPPAPPPAPGTAPAGGRPPLSTFLRR
jgi:hypothetical protein